MRRVRTNGDIRWKGGRVFLSEALVGEPVGLKQISERLWAINYGPLEIGLLDETTMKTIKTPVKVLPMSPGCYPEAGPRPRWFDPTTLSHDSARWSSR